MDSAQKALDALEAAGKAATPRPWRNAGGYLTVRDPDGRSFGGSIYDLDEMGQAHYSAPFQAVPFSRGEDAKLVSLAVNLAAPLAAVVRAAMEYRVHRIEFGSTVGATYRDVRQSRNKLDAALDAFAVAAQEMFP